MSKIPKDPGWRFAANPADLITPDGNRHAPRVEYLRLPTNMPRIFVSQIALAKMQAMVSAIELEIGWLGTATRVKGGVLIEDVFLFQQDVSGGHTEISTDTLNDFITDALTRVGGDFVFNNMRFWGHSHGSGFTYPSGQDDSQMDVFGDFGADFFVRAILNRRGDMNFSLFDWKRGLVFHRTPWQAYGEKLSEKRLQRIQNDIEAEMMEKVSAARKHTIKPAPKRFQLFAPGITFGHFFRTPADPE